MVKTSLLAEISCPDYQTKSLSSRPKCSGPVMVLRLPLVDSEKKGDKKKIPILLCGLVAHSLVLPTNYGNGSRTVYKYVTGFPYERRSTKQILTVISSPNPQKNE